jgi:murein DD-endopeptidase MepM/ murein hydrolase activator NlpD
MSETSVQRPAGGLVTLIRRWFPERQLLIRGPGRIAAVALSQRRQVALALLAVAAVAWTAIASAGVVMAYRRETRAELAATQAQAAAAAAQDLISRLAAANASLSHQRDSALANARAARDTAVSQAVAARDAALARVESASAQAIAAARAARDAAVARADHTAVTDDERLGELAAQTQAAIGQVNAIIKSTGLNPDSLMREAGAPAALPATPPNLPGYPPTDSPPAGSPPTSSPPTGSPSTGPEALALGGPSAYVLNQADHARQLGAAIGRLHALAAVLAQIPLAAPVGQVAITSPFGFRPDPWTGLREFHVGIDLRGPVGAPVYATAPGVVTFAGVATGYGNLIVIDHGFGLSTRYSHLQKILVGVGAAVTVHQKIGLLGSTGWSTGPHLLYETRVDGQPRNPLSFIKGTP